MNETQLYKSFNTIMDMLEVRGYDVENTRKQYGILELSKIYLDCSAPSFIFIDGEKKTKIFYFNSSQYKKHIKSFKFEEEDTEILHIIIILDTINHVILKSSAIFKKNKLKVQLFHLSEVIINISKHELVPLHELLSKKEEQQVLVEYMCTKYQIPWICKADPMAKFLGLEQGQIVKITHSSPTNGEYISYRVCV